MLLAFCIIKARCLLPILSYIQSLGITSESAMDANLRPFHCSSLLGSQKDGEIIHNFPTAGSSGASLMRYHSAPSSIFTSSVDRQCPAVRNVNGVAAEFSSRLFNGHGSLGAYSSSSSVCESKLSLQRDNATDLNGKHRWSFSSVEDLQHYSHNVMDTLGKSHLQPRAQVSAGRGCEEALTMNMRRDHADATAEERTHASSFREIQPLSPRFDLIRHSSLSSTNVLPGNPMEDSSKLQMQTASTRNPEDQAFLSSKRSLQQMPAKSFLMGGHSSSPWEPDDSNMKTNHSLIRHRSSPAGLLSESGFSITSTDKSLLAHCLSADGRLVRQELGLMPGNGVGDWNEASTALEISNAAAPVTHRKRERGSETDFFKPLHAADLQQQLGPLDQVYHDQLASHYIIHGDDNFTVDAVICKSRAKRGCATHPRSIAERVRRTKISERVKKLTELVPNLDKQAHTADMLDEVVDYVKQLKQQVQKLSEIVEKCRCHTMEKDSPS